MYLLEKSILIQVLDVHFFSILVLFNTAKIWYPPLSKIFKILQNYVFVRKVDFDPSFGGSVFFYIGDIFNQLTNEKS